MQTKTGNPLALPLTKDLGIALQDYILNARPESDSKNVFLRMISPFQGLVSGSAINYLYKKWFAQAGLAHLSLDKRSFHSLRRSLGMNMVISGVPVTTVAQVLGHNSIKSTRPYISLDSKHLKECALSFVGIEPARKGKA